MIADHRKRELVHLGVGKATCNIEKARTLPQDADQKGCRSECMHAVNLFMNVFLRIGCTKGFPRCGLGRIRDILGLSDIPSCFSDDMR